MYDERLIFLWKLFLHAIGVAILALILGFFFPIAAVIVGIIGILFIFLAAWAEATTCFDWWSQSVLISIQRDKSNKKQRKYEKKALKQFQKNKDEFYGFKNALDSMRSF